MLLELHSGRIQASFNLENGQLVSLKFKGDELFHGGGKPSDLQVPTDAAGWNNSEIVMFPVIGPVKENKLFLNGHAYPMAQHGLSRHLPWNVVEQRTDKIVFRQEYEGNTPVPNNKITEPLTWPYSYQLEKQFQLVPDGLMVLLRVKNESEDSMQYSIGWHPAFRVLDERVSGRKMAEVQDAKAIELDVNDLSYGPVHVRTDLPYLTLWSPKGSQLLCIEPMSRLQVWEGFESFSDNDFLLGPGEVREHKVEIIVA